MYYRFPSSSYIFVLLNFTHIVQSLEEYQYLALKLKSCFIKVFFWLTQPQMYVLYNILPIYFDFKAGTKTIIWNLICHLNFYTIVTTVVHFFIILQISEFRDFMVEFFTSQTKTAFGSQ